ncbi:DUF6230 family protein [Streptomyces sp. RB6PN25]|uniref:DUF6230 family protein n=1 Tax=Streptomyces humicola TaxID=2953240 RepID=A0ABT1PRT0_9ACTN|nr:DUF6230 family protein [Streptomyces humicola]MCQ4080376.1 DUF6230 family protein [Streptomyces humicola]
MTICTDSTLFSGPAGRTRWKRLAVVMVPTLLASAMVFVAVARGALAASFGVSANSFIVSGKTFEIAASELDGDGFVQFGAVSVGKFESFPEAFTGIRSATLFNLCQSVVQHLPLVGEYTLKTTSTPVHADRLLVWAHDLRGDAFFRDINIGQDASTVHGVPGIRGEPGGFAEQADFTRVNHLRQATRAIHAATFTFPNLHLSVRRGDHSCF